MKNDERNKECLQNIYSITEAADKWNLYYSSLRNVILRGRLREGIDYRKSGNVWLVTHDAMVERYGEPPVNKKNSRD